LEGGALSVSGAERKCATALATEGVLWHFKFMSKAHGKSNGTSRILGAKAFGAISAVEGLKLSHDSRARLDLLRRSGLGGEERRTAVKDAYRSPRASK
jgi:hypothetical protein